MKTLKKINSVSARKISNRVNILSQLDLCTLTKDDAVRNLLNSFDIPYNLFPQKANRGFIFRACINESELPFCSIKRIAYNPNPEYIGRASLPNKGVGYSASDLDIAAIETCQDSLRDSKQRTFFLTIGKWINKDSTIIAASTPDRQTFERVNVEAFQTFFMEHNPDWEKYMPPYEALSAFFWQVCRFGFPRHFEYVEKRYPEIFKEKST